MNERISAEELHVVIGGTGAIGGAVVEELVRRGHRVRSIGRRQISLPAGWSSGRGAHGSASSVRGVAGASVVYQCAAPEYTRWTQEFPTLQANVADAAEQPARAGRRREPLHVRAADRRTDARDDPMAATGKKGSLRARLSNDLMERTLPGVCAWPSVGVGLLRPARRELGVGEQFFGAVPAGRGRAGWAARISPMRCRSCRDIAAGLVTLGSIRRPMARSGISPSAPP